MGASELGRRAEQCGGTREGDVETLWHMTGVLSFLTTSFHPSSDPFSSPSSLPKASSSSLAHLCMCLPSILLICDLQSHLGSLCTLSQLLRADRHLLSQRNLLPEGDIPSASFSLGVHAKGVWQIPLVVFIPSWGETGYHNSAILSTYGFFLCVPLHPYSSPSIRCVVGDHSCPLWQTADKFSWVSLSGEGEGGARGRGFR